MSERQRHLERLADRMLQLKCITLGAQAHGDMTKFYKGNKVLFDAQGRFRDGEYGVFMRKESDWLQRGAPKVAL